MAKVKICGLRTLEDAAIINRCKPDYAGFVFAATKRYVSDSEALGMRRALSEDIQTVGVFVNEPPAHILSLCEQGIINMIQLHGDESEDYIAALKEKTDTPIIKAVRVQNTGQVKKALTKEADFMLFDTYKQGVYGGSGERFSLEILQKSLQEEKNTVPFFLAGGLTPQNIEEVLGAQDCYCVDVSSGVETDGCKDAAKVEEFIRKVRDYRKAW